MRLIKMWGGLGNQMFIYAMYLNMRRRFPNTRLDISHVRFDKAHSGYEIPRLFHTPSLEFHTWGKLLKLIKCLFFKTIYEKKLEKSLIPYLKRYRWPLIYFQGFYQSEKFFADVAPLVRRTYRFDTSMANQKTIALLSRLEKDESSVAVHIRRGDYLEPGHYKTLGCVCTPSYYRRATTLISSMVTHPHFYLFSDDPEWVKAHIDMPQATFVNWNLGKDSWQDMLLMQHCRHNIICNSSFSWWGAWLNSNKNKIVITPDHWFADYDYPDIIPNGWIQVSTQ